MLDHPSVALSRTCSVEPARYTAVISHFGLTVSVGILQVGLGLCLCLRPPVPFIRFPKGLSESQDPGDRHEGQGPYQWREFL